MLNCKNNKRVDKKLDVWANMKRSEYDRTLLWASKKLKSFGVFSKVEDDFVSGKTRVKVAGDTKTKWHSIGHEHDLFRLISEEMKEKLLDADTLNKLGNDHLKYIDF